LILQGSGYRQRQPGLSDPARAGQRHETVGANCPAELLKLSVATDEAAELLPQVASYRRSGNRPVIGRRRQVERGVLDQDARLEVAQCRAWIYPELVDQTVTGLGVGAQGLGLAARSVEGEHEQLPQALAQRVFPAQRLQLADELTVPAERQVCGDPALDRDQGQLAEVRPLGIGETRIGELDEWLPAT
jgi:hypothetical protein